MGEAFIWHSLRPSLIARVVLSETRGARRCEIEDAYLLAAAGCGLDEVSAIWHTNISVPPT
jgi:hypothetical protein